MRNLNKINLLLINTSLGILLSACNASMDTHMEQVLENQEQDSQGPDNTPDKGPDSQDHERPQEEIPPQFWTVNQCGTWDDSVNGNEIKYCIKAAENAVPSGKTLYAFHGMGGDEKFCDHMTADSEPFMTSKNISHVVCPSFGPHWTIHEKNRADSFARFQAYVQTKYRADATLKPVLYGESMGGFNAVKLSGLYPLKFQRAAVGCPAIFSSSVARTFVLNTNQSLLPTSLFGNFDKETALSIIGYSPYFDSVAFPEIYIMANNLDSIGKVTIPIPLFPFTIGGIFQGARDFYQKISTQGGALIHFKELPGEHCEGIPMHEMIEFLGNSCESI